MNAQTFTVSISKHAVDRWIERVDPAASHVEAVAAIERLARTGDHSRCAPDWSRLESYGAFTYVTSATRPGLVIALKSIDDGFNVTTVIDRHKPRSARRGPWSRSARSRPVRLRERRRRPL